MLRLIVSSTNDEGAEPQVTEVTKDTVLMGRGTQCDITLPKREMGASAEHARVQKLKGTWYLFDLNSTNGTSLNGTRIRPQVSVPLTNNDKIYIGRWLIRCRIENPTARHWARGQDADPRAMELHKRLGAYQGEQITLALRAWLNEIEPHERAALLRQVESLAEAGPVREAVANEIERRFAVREACYQAMSSLSQHHSGSEGTLETPEEVARLFRLVDQSLELMLEWIVGCILSRRTFEEKFSAKVTRFFGMGANPIKHALTPSQAGRYLMNWDQERDAEGIKKNLEEALRDLTAHQLALLAGVQASLKAALQRLDPPEMEKLAAEGAFLGMGVRGKAWDHFKATHEELMTNDSKLFNEIIYPSMRQAYLEAHEQHLSTNPEELGYSQETTPGVPPGATDSESQGTAVLGNDGV